MMRCTAALGADGLIDILERLIEPTVGLILAIVSDKDFCVMSAEFQDWLIKNGVRHKVSTTYHPETDGQRERKNWELTEMVAAHELQGNDLLTAAPKVQTQVNRSISKSRGQSPFFILSGFQPKVSSTELPHPIPGYPDPV